MDTDGAMDAAQEPASLLHDLPAPSELEKLTPRALLKRLGLSARRSFSQNFLTDRYVVADIIEAADLSQSDTVLEIGPGLGVMTRGLMSAAGRVVAVELDRKLAELLPRLVDHPEKLEVIQADILQFDPASALPAGYKVVANLPYHITSPALRHLLTASFKPRRMVVMVQKEVADRIAAQPGDTSLLSVMVQIYGRVELVMKVPAEAFFPAPKVDSAVLRIDVYDRPPLDLDDPDDFLRVVAAGFSRRRKQLHNSLSESLWFPPGGEFQVLQAAGIDPARRAQTLTLEEWARLYRAYNQAKIGWQDG
jgi:16S rRNA (adenine1518-N6/adenine1519-N6)-dimethyltransferase